MDIRRSTISQEQIEEALRTEPWIALVDPERGGKPTYICDHMTFDFLGNCWLVALPDDPGVMVVFNDVENAALEERISNADQTGTEDYIPF